MEERGGGERVGEHERDLEREKGEIEGTGKRIKYIHNTMYIIYIEKQPSICKHIPLHTSAEA